MRVLLLTIWKPARGGVVTHVENLIKRSPHAFEIVTYPRFARLPLIRAISFTVLGFLTALRKSRRRKYDLIHAHYAIPQGLLGVALKHALRLPLVVTLHGTDINYLARRRMTRPLVKLVLKQADAVVAVSRFLKEEAEKLGVEAEKVRVIYNGVELPEWEEAEREMSILFVGSLVKQKGIDTLLKAYRIVKERLPEAKLVIVGDGREREALENMSTRLKLKDVFFEGSRNRLGGYYSRSRVLALPSRSEGFGLVALEAMAYGLPVVATRVGGIPEVVTHGEAGMLVEKDDASALAEALIKVMADKALWQKLSQNARKRAAMFSWEKTAQQYANLYAELKR
jgi:N-acetyl-alpha-D-glucosaminyl L-malate synthase BshA